MPRACTVCTHSEREVIDRGLVEGRSARALAALHRVSDDAVTRHRAHLLVPLKQAREVHAEVAEDVVQAIDVVRQLKAINAASLAILSEARGRGDADTALKAVDRIQRQIELQAKLLGELDERPQVNVLIMPEWLAVRSALLEALRSFPEARSAASARLLALNRMAR